MPVCPLLAMGKSLPLEIRHAKGKKFVVALATSSSTKFRTPDLRGLYFCRFLVVDGKFEPEVRAGETGLKFVQLLTEAADDTGSMW